MKKIDPFGTSRYSLGQEQTVNKQVLKRVGLYYHLCPHCGRATPAAARESYCPNDGTKLLSACPACQAPITSPFSRFCTNCGQAFSQMARRKDVER